MCFTNVPCHPLLADVPYVLYKGGGYMKELRTNIAATQHSKHYLYLLISAFK